MYNCLLFYNKGYKKYKLVEPAAGVDAIIVTELITDYSIENEDLLTRIIVEGVSLFEHDIISFYSKMNI